MITCTSPLVLSGHFAVFVQQVSLGPPFNHAQVTLLHRSCPGSDIKNIGFQAQL